EELLERGIAVRERGQAPLHPFEPGEGGCPRRGPLQARGAEALDEASAAVGDRVFEQRLDAAGRLSVGIREVEPEAPGAVDAVVRVAGRQARDAHPGAESL